ncbi:MAG: N-6 DNA methylase [Candidatus Niyogibacteria bacterium]|nr:N-6 DNA methylase [Candidatus Niyogibacteria bacterium]
MPRTKLEEIIESSGIKEFSQFFRLKTRAEGNFRPSDERLSQYDDADFFEFVKLGQIEFSGSQRLLVASARVIKDLSERSGKKAQYEKAKKILRELSVYSAGIFIFYDKSGNFRFSLVYPEAVGTKREWSNFRRFTYFVSKELTNKTFLQRVGDGDFSTLEKVKDAFSVEKVTKEFYLEYRKLFDSLMEDLSKNHTFLNEASKNYINTENFAKKLLGQIVFLYFIQKKGWIGVPAGKKWGEGDKNFMGNIYKEAIIKKANFYNDYLEKLFYNALNNAHRDSADPSFSKDFGSRIPFLNGGLFEAEYDWKNSLMYLDNKIFQSIFDVFERYNFTVEEESPDDKEIAVDPEMLGKVFENLLPENLRKGKGTYYTPREIVYYMCRESLVNYLVSNHSNITEENIRNYIFYSESFENFKKQKGESFTPGQWKELDDLLANIKVCDPACGSGAFLVGMLNMIVKLRIFLQTTPDHHLIPQKKEYELKRETIQNCIYGVDIDPGAIEIAKLRLWLALVVDYDLEDIEPLPNLDYRLMCGNSLLEEFEGIKFYNGEKETQASLLTDPEKDKKVEALRKKVKEYFSIHDDKEKLKKRKEINDIKDWLIGTALQKRYRDLASQKKEAESRANMLDEKSRKQYLSGFSKWLGSSANIQKALESLHNPKKEKPFFIWKLEFIDVFEEKGGFDVVIGNPPYVSAVHNQDDPEIREIYRKKYTQVRGAFDLYVVFLLRGLDISSDKAIFTWIIPNKFLVSDYAAKVRETLKASGLKEIVIVSNLGVFGDTGVYPIIILGNRQHVNDVIEYEVENLDDLKLKDDLRVREKIKSRFQTIKNLGLKVGSGTTGFQAQQIKKLIVESEHRSEQSMPFVVSGSIDRYHIKFSHVQFLKKKFEHPFINYDKKVIAGSKWSFWGSPKIIIAGMTKEIEATYTEKSLAIGIGVYAIYTFNGFDPKFILALLNSKYLSHFLKVNFKDKHLAGGYLAINKSTIEQLPIVDADKKSQKPFIDLVNKILAITKDSDYLENSTKQAKVRDYEKQIDQLVYKLYTLTPEDIKIVEKSQ